MSDEPRTRLRFIERLLPSLLLGSADALSLNAPGKFTPEEDVAVQSAELIVRLTRDLAAARERVRELRENGARLVEAADGWKIRCQAEEIIRVRVEAERDAKLNVIIRAAQIMRGDGVQDQGEAWDMTLRLLDAALDAGRKG